MSNVNDSYFDGHYKDIWRVIIPEELTKRETEFMLQYFRLQPGSKVLDLMCGYGRHALALGRSGVAVTGVDNLGDYVDEIKVIAEKENLPVTVYKDDVIQFRNSGVFDLAICMGNSLNFFGRDDVIRLFQSVSSQLKPGGSLLINSWSLLETVAKSYIENSWGTFNGLKFLTAAKFLFHPTRIEAETTVVAETGVIEVKKAIDYIYSVSEIEEMLQLSSLVLKEIYSIPGRKKFSLGEPRAYIVAEKI